MSPDSATEAKEQIKTVLAQSPRRYGLDGNRWSIEFIQQAIHWLQACTKAGAWKILKRLGFSRQQALTFVRSPDPLFQLKMRTITQAFTRALCHPQQAAVLFEDELSYFQQPDATVDWGVTNQTAPRVWRGTHGNRLTRIGATMDGITGKVLYHQGDKFGLRQMQDLYHRIRQEYDQPTIFVVQDNWYRVHDHPAALQTAADLHLTPLFLPTYASWLNPIEKLWRWLRQKVLYNHSLADDLPALRQSVDKFLGRFVLGSDNLLHYCGLLPN